MKSINRSKPGYTSIPYSDLIYRTKFMIYEKMISQFYLQIFHGTI